MFVRTILIVLGAAASLTASAQSGLATFVEANGCKLFAAQRDVTRLREIASQGKVVWDGQCKDGLIEGAGVLRQEGTLNVDGKTKKFAYYLSGTARMGLREGQWQRETMDRFVDSPRFYTSASTLQFDHGVAIGKLNLLKITHPDQLTPAFRQLVIETQRDQTPANEALRQATPVPSSAPPPAAAIRPIVRPPAAAPAATPPAPAPPPASPRPPAAPPAVAVAPAVAPPPAAAPKVVAPPPAAPRPPVAPPAVAVAPAVAPPASTYVVTASSQHLQYGPEGLLTAKQPGWHSASPPDYPEWIVVDFQSTRDIRTLSLRAQDGNQNRAPKVIRIESSADGKEWAPQVASEIPCAPNTDDGWLKLNLRSPAIGRYLKFTILANCGDPTLVTIRGLRFD